ncbi:MAG: PAS domain S-box protein, partial [Bilophila sp.]
RFLHGNSGVNAQKRFTEGVDEVPVEFRRLGRDGTYYWVSSSLVPLRTSTGETTRRGLILVRDITERKQQEQQQRVTEQYDRALRNIYDELYELNITQDSYRIVYHVQNKYVTPPDSGRLSTVIESVRTNMIHPDDSARFQQFFDIDTVRATFAAGRECLIGEFRKLWKDGAFHWSTLTLFPVGACASDEIYLVFIMDIGEKKKIEELTQRNHLLEQQRLADERYRIIIDQTGTLVFEWCRDGNERFVSPEIPKRFAGNYNGRSLLDLWRDDGVIHPDDLTLLNAFVQKTRGGCDYTELTARFRTHAGQHAWCKVALTCLRNEDGLPKRYIGTINNVDEATRSILALKYRAEY